MISKRRTQSTMVEADKRNNDDFTSIAATSEANRIKTIDTTNEFAHNLHDNLEKGDLVPVAGVPIDPEIADGKSGGSSSCVEPAATKNLLSTVTFSKPQNGKLLPSMVSMMVTMVGLGVMGLPMAFAEAGVLGGCFLVVICAIFTDIGLVALVRVQKVTGCDNYEDVGDFYFGKFGRWFTYFLVNLDLLMAGISMLQPFVQYSGDVILKWSNCFRSEDDYNANLKPGELTLKNLTKSDQYLAHSECPGWNAFTIAILPLLVAFPLILQTSVDALKYANFGAVICLIGAWIVFFVYYFTWANGSIEDESLGPKFRMGNYHDFGIPVHETVSIGAPFGFLVATDAIGIVFFSYVCFFQILLLYSELAHKKDIYPVIHCTTFGFAMPLYLFAGLAGYFLFGDKLAVDGQSVVFALMDDDFVPKNIIIFAVGVMSALKMATFLNPFRDRILDLINFVTSRFYKKAGHIENTLLYRLAFAVGISLFIYPIALYMDFYRMLVYAGSITGASLNGYVVGFVLIAYVKKYGILTANSPESKAVTSTWYYSCGILDRATFMNLSKKMKTSYVTAWALIVYGIFGTIFGLMFLVADDVFKYVPTYK